MQFREKIHKSHLEARGETVIVLVYGDLLQNVRHGVLPFSPAGEVEAIWRSGSDQPSPCCKPAGQVLELSNLQVVQVVDLTKKQRRHSRSDH